MSVMNPNTFQIGGELAVRRLGFGAMRLTGPGVWGPPENLLSAQAVLRRVIELGINFIDTADVYGPGDNERLIRDTLKPYSAGLVIGTKGGMLRSGPATPDNHRSAIDNSEAHMIEALDDSLKRLGVEHGRAAAFGLEPLGRELAPCGGFASRKPPAASSCCPFKKP